MKATRKIRMMLSRQPIMEGAGVHLNRVFGYSEAPRRDPFLLPDEVLAKMGAVKAQRAFSNVPVCSVEERVSRKLRSESIPDRSSWSTIQSLISDMLLHESRWEIIETAEP